MSALFNSMVYVTKTMLRPRTISKEVGKYRKKRGKTRD
jgi:hypothetical protein